MLSSFLLALAAASALLPAVRADQASCESFQLTCDDEVDATVWNTEFFNAGDLVNITNLFSSIETDTLPAFCRVQIAIVTNQTAGSHANTEVWLPEPDAWNGRFVGFGNGGFGGGVTVSDLGFVAISQGFAGMATDTGHNSTAIDGSWGGPHNDNAIIDFGFRAVHLSTIAGKLVTEQYYSNAAKHSYWLSCSTGGRQGLKEAQMFPDDYDGIVVGSPANWMTHLPAWSIHVVQNVLPEGSPQFIPGDFWTGFLAQEVLRQCDLTDGVADGIVGNPLACHFRPETLTCRPGQNTSTCLNLDQIHALHRIYSPYFETNQTFVFNALYPGGEPNFVQTLTAPPFPVSTDYFAFMVLNDTSFDFNSLDLADIQLAEQINPGSMDAINPNLTAFVGPEHNGKVIHYVGWGDQLISPGNSLHYFETVQAFTLSETEMDMDDFYRLFTVPGMGHCQNGFGPNAFGGSGQAASGMPPLKNDPEHNVLSAIMAWVEEGVAPENFTGVKYFNDNSSEGVEFTRPLCKYPSEVKFVDGNVNDSSSYTCVSNA